MDPYSQNSNGTYNNPYTPGGYENTKSKKLLLLVVGLLVVILVAALIFHFTRPESQQSKYIKSATAAARKQTPNAKVSNLKVAGGFALSTVSDPTASGQANAGYTVIFKVSADGSMKQIASGSYISPLDLLNLGIPLATQAKITESSIGQVKQTLASECNYTGDSTPGYSGFDGSFSPGGWEIDAGTLDGIEQALSATIANENAETTPSKAVICVNATQKNSNTITDPNTYASTFTLEVQFITSDGTLTTHTLTFIIGSYHQLSYTLDGQDITPSVSD